MAEATTVILVLFGVLLILGLIGGIIAIIIVERNRKKKEQEQKSQQGDLGTSTSPFGIQSVLDKTRYFTVDVLGPLDSDRPCTAYSYDHKTFTTKGGTPISNALISNIPSTSDVAKENGGTPLLLAAESKVGSRVEWKNPEKDGNLEKFDFSWIYDSRSDKKTWCLQSNKNLCWKLKIDRLIPIITGQTFRVELEAISTPTPEEFQWNNVPPPTTICTK